MHKFIFSAVVFLFNYSFVVSQDIYLLRNKETIQQVCSTIINQAITDFSLSPDYALSVQFVRQSELNSFLRPAIIQSLTGFSKNIYETSSGDTTLRIDAAKIQVSYSQPFSDGWFQSSKTVRTAEVELFLELISRTNGKILFSASIQKNYADTIYFSAISDVEDPMDPLTIGKRPIRTFFKNFLEPGIVTLATGIAVYLFFTVRS